MVWIRNNSIGVYASRYMYIMVASFSCDYNFIHLVTDFIKIYK